MFYKSCYQSPLGEIVLVSKENQLIGAWMEGQKYYLGKLKGEIQEKDNQEILIKAKSWLNRYFKRRKT